LSVQKNNTDRLDWFKKARFGMFIHWGIYSVPARGEWHLYHSGMDRNEYEKYASLFGEKQLIL